MSTVCFFPESANDVSLTFNPVPPNLFECGVDDAFGSPNEIEPCGDCIVAVLVTGVLKIFVSFGFELDGVTIFEIEFKFPPDLGVNWVAELGVEPKRLPPDEDVVVVATVALPNNPPVDDVVVVVGKALPKRLPATETEDVVVVAVVLLKRLLSLGVVVDIPPNNVPVVDSLFVEVALPKSPPTVEEVVVVGTLPSETLVVEVTVVVVGALPKSPAVVVVAGVLPKRLPVLWPENAVAVVVLPKTLLGVEAMGFDVAISPKRLLPPEAVAPVNVVPNNPLVDDSVVGVGVLLNKLPVDGKDVFTEVFLKILSEDKVLFAVGVLLKAFPVGKVTAEVFPNNPPVAGVGVALPNIPPDEEFAIVVVLEVVFPNNPSDVVLVVVCCPPPNKLLVEAVENCVLPNKLPELVPAVVAEFPNKLPVAEVVGTVVELLPNKPPPDVVLFALPKILVLVGAVVFDEFPNKLPVGWVDVLFPNKLPEFWVTFPPKRPPEEDPTEPAFGVGLVFVAPPNENTGTEEFVVLFPDTELLPNENVGFAWLFEFPKEKPLP